MAGRPSTKKADGAARTNAAMPVKDVIAALGKAAAEINAALGAKLEPQ